MSDAYPHSKYTINNSCDIAKEEVEAAIGDQSATLSARGTVAHMEHDPGLNPLGPTLKEALWSVGIEKVARSLELTCSGSHVSVTKYSNIGT